MTTVLVLATANSDKAREIGEILAGSCAKPLTIVPYLVGGGAAAFVLVGDGDADRAAAGRLPVLDAAPDVEETGSTIEENARLKATGWCEALGVAAIADDTALEVDALNGAPGVRSARYAGEGATYSENVARLLADLDGVARESRTCRFATVALAKLPDEREIVARGEVEGVVTEAAIGDGGFGYDAVFQPVDGGGRTFGEMTPAEKHALSHRGRAFAVLAAGLRAEPDIEL